MSDFIANALHLLFPFYVILCGTIFLAKMRFLDTLSVRLILAKLLITYIDGFHDRSFDMVDLGNFEIPTRQL